MSEYHIAKALTNLGRSKVLLLVISFLSRSEVRLTNLSMRKFQRSCERERRNLFCGAYILLPRFPFFFRCFFYLLAVDLIHRSFRIRDDNKRSSFALYCHSMWYIYLRGLNFFVYLLGFFGFKVFGPYGPFIARYSTMPQ